jgi:type VI secretion system VasD/TssJ family lipoprotein
MRTPSSSGVCGLRAALVLSLVMTAACQTTKRVTVVGFPTEGMNPNVLGGGATLNVDVHYLTKKDEFDAVQNVRDFADAPTGQAPKCLPTTWRRTMRMVVSPFEKQTTLRQDDVPSEVTGVGLVGHFQNPAEDSRWKVWIPARDGVVEFRIEGSNLRDGKDGNTERTQ